MQTRSFEKLDTHLEGGHVYRRELLLSFSNAVDRDLSTLVNKGLLAKVGSGLYYKPMTSRFGTLPPDNDQLVKAFLRDDQFLLYSWNQYNTLGLGLTQLYNHIIVYNYKRHGLFQLDEKQFDFRRPARGFPDKLTAEFLLVDLVNNLNELAEDTDFVKNQIKKNCLKFNLEKVATYAKQYGKIKAHNFFKEIIH